MQLKTTILPSVSRYLIYSLLIFTPFARAGVQDWAVTVIHLVTLLAVTAWLIEKSITWNWRWIKTPLDKPIISLLVLLIITTFFSQHRPTSIRAVLLVANYIVIFYLIVHTVRTRTHLQQLLAVIIAVGVLLAMLGFIKLGNANPFPWWDYPGSYHNDHRLTATYGNANHLAGYMEMTAPLSLGLLLMGLKPGTRLLLTFAALLLSAALIFSLSRGGWIGVLAGFGFMAALLLSSRHFDQKKIIAGLMCGLLLATVIIVGTTGAVKRIGAVTELDKTPTLVGRIHAWSGITEMIGDYPFWGAGPGTFADMFTRYQPPGIASRYFYGHNDYLHFVSEAGLFLVPIMLWMIAAMFFQLLKNANHPCRMVRGTAIGVMSGMVAIAVHSISDFNLHIPANALLFTTIAAIGSVAATCISIKQKP